MMPNARLPTITIIVSICMLRASLWKKRGRNTTKTSMKRHITLRVNTVLFMLLVFSYIRNANIPIKEHHDMELLNKLTRKSDPLSKTIRPERKIPEVIT
jgi:hypothetical protein